MKKQKIKSRNGITLIALVITIIVLLILAGVSIATLTGENGILAQVGNARVETEIAEEKEAIKLAYMSVLTESLDKVTAEELNKEFTNNGTKAKASGTETLMVEFTNTGRKYEVDSNGNVTGPIEGEDIELNEYGFYFGKPYVFNVPESEYVEYMVVTLYEDGSAQMINSMEHDTMSITSTTNKRIDLSNGMYLEFSEDGKSLSMGVKLRTFLV